MRREIISILGLTLCSTFVCAQQSTTLVKGKDYMCFTSVDAPNFAGIHSVDRLIKEAPERSAIEVSEGGDYTFRMRYRIFYFKNNTKKYNGSGTHQFEPKQIDRISNLLKNIDTVSFDQHVIYQYIGKYRSSANEDFFYVFIVNGKIVKSLISNVPLNEISDENVKEKMKLFILLFGSVSK
jgi:hypothetical protein